MNAHIYIEVYIATFTPMDHLGIQDPGCWCTERAVGRLRGVLSSTSSTERHLNLQLLSLFSGPLSPQMKFPRLSELCRFFGGGSWG